MSKEDQLAQSEQLKQELGRLEHRLSECRTFRYLFAEAFTYLQAKIHDSMIGVTTFAEVQRASALLDEVMPHHMKRIQAIVGTTAPTTPRGGGAPS